jgi:hypothetical protein
MPSTLSAAQVLRASAATISRVKHRLETVANDRPGVYVTGFDARTRNVVDQVVAALSVVETILQAEGSYDRRSAGYKQAVKELEANG